MGKKIFVGFLCFCFAAASVFFGIEFFTKTGIFKRPGELVFSEAFSDSETEIYRNSLAEIELDSDLNFKTILSDSRITENSQGGELFLTDIFVPTTDFYSVQDNISLNDFNNLFQSNDSSVISVSELDSSEKLLGIDEKYFLDDFSEGAKFKYVVVEGEETDLEKIKAIIQQLTKSLPDKTNTLSLAQTGVTAFGRGMNAKMNLVGDGKYFIEEIGEYLAQFDLTHTSSESSFSDSASSSNICADKRFVDSFLGAGIDIVELTGNHNLDCGAKDAIETIDKYEELNIRTVGGGRDAEEAERPLEIKQKNNGVTILAYNESTGGATTGDEPGANKYSEEDAKEQILAAKARGDLVIVDIQYYECAEYDTSYENTACDKADSSAGNQIGLFRELIDMGADVVVGTSAHQTQTYERYKDGEIYYGLGNIFFDQCWWPGTTRSLGLIHYFWNGRLIQTRKFGTVYDETLQTRLMSEDELNNFIERLNNSKPEQ